MIGAALRFLGLIPREVWYLAAAALLTWSAYSWVYDRGAASRNAEIIALESRIRTLESANEDNGRTIQSLTNANRALANAARADLADAERAAAAVEKERARLEGALSLERERRAKLYRESQHAKQWGDTGMPAAVFRGLRVEGADPPN